MTEPTIRIGSRGSTLAMAQAALVQRAFAEAGHPSTIVVVETAGDRRAPDTAWGEGAFVAAIERALLDGSVDVAVHSAKDVPTDEDARLRIAAYLPRADPRDALVVRAGAAHDRLDDLPAGARVGTDSPRRTGFLRARRPDLVFHPLHGNVDTRLRRLDAGETDALVLACAGLDRLGLSDRIAERLDPEVLPPAAGQGAVAVQVRSADERLLAIARSFDHRATRAAVEAEREFLRASGGGCRAPIGAIALAQDGVLELLGGHAWPDGSSVVLARVVGRLDDPVALGRRLAGEVEQTDGRFTRSGDESARRPRVLVARAVDQARELMAALRAEALDPVLVPAVEIDFASRRAQVERVARRLRAYRWVIVTSANGARAILDAVDRVGADPAGSRWAAVGPSTADVLERRGLDAAFLPSRPSSAALAAELPIAGGDPVLLVLGSLADRALGRTLRARGAKVEDLIAYRTIEAPEGSRRLLRAAIESGPIEAIVLTSGSTARGLRSLAERESIDLAAIPAICIGAQTAEAASAVGFQVAAVSPTPGVGALAKLTKSTLDAQLQVTP